MTESTLSTKAERMARAKAAVDRDIAKAKAKKRQDPREVAVYLEAIRAYRKAVQVAIDVAAFGKFSPEALRFVSREHAGIRDLQAQVEAFTP